MSGIEPGLADARPYPLYSLAVVYLMSLEVVKIFILLLLVFHEEPKQYSSTFPGLAPMRPWLRMFLHLWWQEGKRECGRSG